jgi:hypothetical protein
LQTAGGKGEDFWDQLNHSYYELHLHKTLKRGKLQMKYFLLRKLIKKADLNGFALFTFVNVQLQALAESVPQRTSRYQ